jgi:hypothetical protein
MQRFICWLLGHKWRDEKEFVSCGRCHKVHSWREFSNRRQIGL